MGQAQTAEPGTCGSRFTSCLSSCTNANDVPADDVMSAGIFWKVAPSVPLQQPKLKLHHFEHHTFGAPGEPVRLAFAVGGIEFEDCRIPRQGDAWRLFKGSGTCPFQQLPLLEADGVLISQSNAILRYAGQLAGLYPANEPLRAGKADQVLGTIQDIKTRMFPSMLEEDPQKKARMRARLAVEILPWWLGHLESALQANDAFFNSERGFCIGDTLTTADLALDCFLGWFDAGAFTGIQERLLDQYPRLRMVREVVASVPRVNRWRQEHPTKYFHESDWRPALQGLRSASEVPAKP
eukprot:gnl/TRDRNA2_/TRDRNA2_173709_c0_seq1.p1 gnl/TRDRNA2_/TRDRNA2_173709_c0~~gnl/TRDRNA2_/TRDRNA2_173709_c0_seq1.p1  ORF type:complete len:295 (-),score=46.99 gnl/TRDRNA2_/TRDRNA2_173709_c0_seq1:149-1033(-)